MSPEQEAAIRLDERLKTLREVRKHASKMDHESDGDPYLWGYGGSKIVAYLTRTLAATREQVDGK